MFDRTRKGACALYAAMLVSTTACPVWAKLVNILTPEHPVAAVSPGGLEGFGPELAIDRNPATMYRAPLSTVNGILIRMPTPTIVKALRLSSGQDHPACDPSSYAIEGSDDGVNFVVLGSGEIGMFRGRLHSQTFVFDNNETYNFYRITFPSVQDPSVAEFCSVGEVELLGSQDDNPDKLAQYWFSEYALGGGGGWHHGSASGGAGGGAGGGSSGGGSYPDLQPLTPDQTIVVPEPGALALAMAVAGSLLLRRRSNAGGTPMVR